MWSVALTSAYTASLRPSCLYVLWRWSSIPLVYRAQPRYKPPEWLQGDLARQNLRLQDSELSNLRTLGRYCLVTVLLRTSWSVANKSIRRRWSELAMEIKQNLADVGSQRR